MATKASKNSRTRSASSKKKPNAKTAGKRIDSAGKFKAKPAATRFAGASDRYEADLVTRGEAQQLDDQGKLPLDATHAIVGKDKDGKPTIRRARFKAY